MPKNNRIAKHGPPNWTKDQDAINAYAREYRKRPEVAARLEEQKQKRVCSPEWEKRKHKYRLAKYGVTTEQYADMWRMQSGKCAICFTDSPGWKGWNIDHCHNTGRVRGILCTKCNIALGLFGDNVSHIFNAIKYLYS